MTLRGRALFEDITGNVMAFAAFISIPVFLLHALGAEYSVLSLFLTLPPFLLLYACRVKVKSFWVFLPAHIAALGLPFFALSNIPLFAALMLFAVVSVTNSFIRKVGGEDAYGGAYVWIGTLFCAITAAHATVYGIEGIIPLVLFLEFILIAGFIALKQMRKLDISLQIFEKSRPDMDTRRVIRFNNALTAGFLLIISAAAAVSLGFNTGFAETAFRAVSDAVRWVIEAFLRFMMFMSEIFGGKTVSAMESAPQQGNIFEVMESAEPSPLAAIIETVVLVAGIAAMVAAAGFFIWWLAMLLYKSFDVKDSRDVEEKLSRGGVERAARRAARRHDFGKGREREIRRLYYKTVKAQKEIAPKSTDTTGDILKRSRTDITELTREYEGVRYG